MEFSYFPFEQFGFVPDPAVSSHIPMTYSYGGIRSDSMETEPLAQLAHADQDGTNYISPNCPQMPLIPPNFSYPFW